MKKGRTDARFAHRTGFRQFVNRKCEFRNYIVEGVVSVMQVA